MSISASEIVLPRKKAPDREPIYHLQAGLSAVVTLSTAAGEISEERDITFNISYQFCIWPKTTDVFTVLYTLGM